MEKATVLRFPSRFEKVVHAGVDSDPVLRVLAYKYFAMFPTMDIVAFRALARVFEKVSRPLLAPEDVAALLDHEEDPVSLIATQAAAAAENDCSGGGVRLCLEEIALLEMGQTDHIREYYAVALMSRLHVLADVCRLVRLDEEQETDLRLDGR